MEPTMSSSSGQSMNYLSPPYANSNCGSLRSYDSICSSIISSTGGEVHINAAYDNLESDVVISSSNHDYEDLQSIRTECKVQQPAHGPRSKTNDLYEPTGPLKHRVRQITECSDDSTASSTTSESLPGKKESCLSKLILFLILAFSVAALVLVLLIINGTVGPKCGCKDFNPENKPSSPITGEQSSVQNLLTRIDVLEKAMKAMKTKMEARDNAVKMFVTKYENQVEVLQAKVNKTANKVALVDGVWVNMTNIHDALEKKLDTEFKLLNESVKGLNKNDNELTSSVNKLRQKQNLTNMMRERLAINVTQLESRVQELRKTSNNVSSRASSLEKGYTQMNNLMRALKAINGAQNASQQDLQSMHKRLIDSLTAVNATLNDKLKNLGASSGKPAANFSTCKHRMLRGVSTTADKISGLSSKKYSEPQGKRAMGITCSTNIARHYKLTEHPDGSFTCSCRNLSPAFGSHDQSMWCDLHVWECPI